AAGDARPGGAELDGVDAARLAHQLDAVGRVLDLQAFGDALRAQVVLRADVALGLGAEPAPQRAERALLGEQDARRDGVERLHGVDDAAQFHHVGAAHRKNLATMRACMAMTAAPSGRSRMARSVPMAASTSRVKSRVGLPGRSRSMPAPVMLSL